MRCSFLELHQLSATPEVLYTKTRHKVSTDNPVRDSRNIFRSRIPCTASEIALKISNGIKDL